LTRIRETRIPSVPEAIHQTISGPYQTGPAGKLSRGKNRKESIGIEPRGLSVPKAAAYYGISPNAYRRLMREGKVPQPIKIPCLDRQIIDKLQLDAVLDTLSKGAA